MRIKSILLVVLLTRLSLAMSQKLPADYVDPFIGTENNGNVFPGPSMPFGMVRVSPDCKLMSGKSPNTNSGYASGMPVYGFSQTHVSGTGGGAKYGNILLMPVTGAVNLDDHASILANEQACAGYYAASLVKYNIKAELTATHSTGVHRYTFPKTDQAAIIIDAASFLVKGSTIQRLVQSGVKIISNSAIEGFGTVRGGWNEGAPYTVYFYMELNTPAKSMLTWRNHQILKDVKNAYPDSHDSITCGAVACYNTRAGQQIVAKVGISFISTQKARQNLLAETNGKTFDQISHAAKNNWNNLLKRIAVEGDEDKKKMFYTALYHTLLMPSDRTGENPLWQSAEPYYDDYYAIWDTYRASNPLITLIDQKRQEDILRSLIDIYKHEGYMPDARSGNYSGLTQGGTDADVLFTDAFLKGLKNINYQTAYESMIKNAEVEPQYPKKNGRGGISDYKKLGYVPSETVIAGSRTMEYANNDAAIATLARALHKNEDVAKYTRRADNWVNLWRADARHSGAAGFIWPRKHDGSWNDNYDYLTRGNFKGFLYEGNTWTYSLFVPHDVKKLIEKCGGNSAFIARLDTFFAKKYYDVNNEPGFLTPCLYTWAGRPDKTAETIRHIMDMHYSSKRGGLPGNDDSGAMSSWLAMNMMGFYPNTGQDVYLITAPVFNKTTIKLNNGRSFTIIAHNLTNNNKYVCYATLNNKVLSRAWFKHSEIKNGAVLELTMSDKPGNWGQCCPPPSMSDNAE